MKKQLQIHDDCQIFHFAVGLSPTHPCKAFIEGKNLTIIVTDDDETYFWRFTERTPGHYCCNMSDCVPEDFTLHRFPKGLYLEGSVKYGDDNRLAEVS